MPLLLLHLTMLFTELHSFSFIHTFGQIEHRRFLDNDGLTIRIRSLILELKIFQKFTVVVFIFVGVDLI